MIGKMAVIPLTASDKHIPFKINDSISNGMVGDLRSLILSQDIRI